MQSFNLLHNLYHGSIGLYQEGQPLNNKFINMLRLIVIHNLIVPQPFKKNLPFQRV